MPRSRRLVALVVFLLTVLVAAPVRVAAGDPADATGPIDGYVHDPLPTSGRAADICAAGPRPGPAAAFALIAEAFPWAESGGSYSCRTSSTCGFVIVDPVAEAGRVSDCWSSHALGRALDVMVGGSTPDGWARDRGDELVAWLLAPDHAGRAHARARRLGVQTIVWDDRCWRADRDQAIAAPGAMRRCARGHHDHVHLDFSRAGADAQTSGYGPLPPPAPPTPPSPIPPPIAVAGGVEHLTPGGPLGYGDGSIVFGGWLDPAGEIVAVVTAESGRETQHRYLTAADGRWRAVIEGLEGGPLVVTLLAAGPPSVVLGTWTLTER